MNKNALTLTVLLFSVPFFYSCKQQPEEVPSEKLVIAEPNPENKTTASYKVEGMACAFGCAKLIEKEVAALDGVYSFSVNFEEGTADIVFDKSITTSEEIKKHVSQLNDGQYKITEVSAEQNENNSSTEKSAQIKELPNVKSFNISFPNLITYFMRRL